MAALSTLTSTGAEPVVTFRGPAVTQDVPILCIHGFLSSGTIFLTNPDASAWPRGCARAGYRSYAADFGGPSTWGNDDFLDAVDSAITWANTEHGTTTDKIAIVGTSMGTWGLEWAWLHPDRVAAVAIVLPVPSMEGLHDRNTLDLGDVMEATYGGLAELEAQYPARDPMQNTDLVAEIADRVAFFYSPTDVIGIESDVDAFVAATGIHAVDVGDGGHSLEWDQQQVLDWLIPTIRRNT